MSTEEKQNLQTYQDSNSFKYPQNEKELSNLIKKFYKANNPIEIIGTGSKRKIGKPLQCSKTIDLSMLSNLHFVYIPLYPCFSVSHLNLPCKVKVRPSAAVRAFTILLII